jgi:rhamnosyltransferase
MNTTKTEIYAVVITYLPKKEVLENIQILIMQGVRVVVVDNASQGDSEIEIRALETFDSVKILRNATNLGIATALNQGILHAKNSGASWIFTFDQDSQITPRYIDSMLELYQYSEGLYGTVGLLCPHYVNQTSGRSMVPKDDRWGTAKNRFPSDQFVERFTLMTSGMLFKTELFDRIGPFRDYYFIDHVDTEYSLRARKHGYFVLQSTQIVLLHNLGEESVHSFFGKKPVITNHNFRRRYTITRNIIFVWKDYFRHEPKWVFSCLKNRFIELIKILLYENNRISKFRAIALGIVDAIRGKGGPYSY